MCTSQKKIVLVQRNSYERVQPFFRKNEIPIKKIENVRQLVNISNPYFFNHRLNKTTYLNLNQKPVDSKMNENEKLGIKRRVSTLCYFDMVHKFQTNDKKKFLDKHMLKRVNSIQNKNKSVQKNFNSIENYISRNIVGSQIDFRKSYEKDQ